MESDAQRALADVQDGGEAVITLKLGDGVRVLLAVVRAILLRLPSVGGVLMTSNLDCTADLFNGCLVWRVSMAVGLALPPVHIRIGQNDGVLLVLMLLVV